MTDSPKLSRRDWFRLRVNREADTTKTRANSMGEKHDGLQPIAHPENHDGMDLSALPPMREAILTRDQVSELFADIEQLATEILFPQLSNS